MPNGLDASCANYRELETELWNSRQLAQFASFPFPIRVHPWLNSACATYFGKNYRRLQAPAGFLFLCLIEKNQLLVARRTEQRQGTIRE
jgi:hypothetical protein